jgi:hypothetical protein
MTDASQQPVKKNVDVRERSLSEAKEGKRRVASHSLQRESVCEATTYLYLM